MGRQKVASAAVALTVATIASAVCLGRWTRGRLLGQLGAGDGAAEQQASAFAVVHWFAALLCTVWLFWWATLQLPKKLRWTVRRPPLF